MASVSVITGGAGGMGLATAKIMGRDHALVLCDVRQERLDSARVALDENLHMVFYRNLMQAALDIAPDEAMCAIRDEVLGFSMPGMTMPGFQENAILIAKAGIYDLRIHHDDVVQPVLRFWKIQERNDFGAVGEEAREQVIGFMKMVDERATYYEEKAKARETVSA